MYLPGVQELTPAVQDEIDGADLLLVDGTTWHDDELVRLGLAAKTAHDMGHLHIGGRGGSLEVLTALGVPRIVYVHVNNTNPVLLEDSAERAAVTAAGSSSGSTDWNWRSDMTAPDTALVRRLRAHAAQYHSAHPFHVRMNDGTLTPDQIRGWVANRFAYQEAIPVKDAAILSNCPDVGVRRRWIRRITDHDGVHDGREPGSGNSGQGGIEAWLRLGEACGLSRSEISTTGTSGPGCGSPSTPTSASPARGRGSRRSRRR